VEVPFRLTRREDAFAADAVLVFADGFAPVAAAVGGAAPQVFPVRGGFLLIGAGAVPGAIRLRRLAGDLFIPADADLVPALLPEEAAGLTRDRGLVFLPGGPVLAFDPAAPLPTSRWVAPAVVTRDEWGPLPEPPPRAERLTAIERPSPMSDVLNIGRPDGADPLPADGRVPDDARPPPSSAADRAAGAAKLGAGTFLNWLGSLAGLSGLAKFGADLARKAIEQVPRLSEKLLGAQEAALREVLRQLRDGDAEAALRRAPPAFADPDTPARVGTDANLGTRDPRYDLRSLVGGGGGGVGWLGGGDVWARLADEYRRLAREATARGDFRRAAYLLGLLLRDVRAAANALLAGGLFRDAAVLLRDKLHDAASAAAAFEQAGEFDEAVRLYDRAGLYETAGTLLRRLGDEAAARGYFVRAADGLADRNEWLKAGDLMRRTTGDLDAATTYFRRGWDADGSVACGCRLLDDRLAAADWTGAEHLFDAAEARFAPPRSADAAAFFHHARRAAAGRLPPDRGDDLADRTRLLFARHLADRGPADVGSLFGTPGNWPAPVVRDAAVAARVRPLVASHDVPVRIVAGPVHAVVVAPNSGDIIVAAAGGIIGWRRNGTRDLFAASGAPPLGLAVSADGSMVVDLRAEGGEPVARCYTAGVEVARRGLSELIAEGAKNPLAGWYLEPVVGTDRGAVSVTVATPRQRLQLSGTYLAATSHNRFMPTGGLTNLLVRAGADRAWDWDERFLRLLADGEPPRSLCRWLPHWTPAVPPGSSLTVPRTDWRTPSPGVLEVAGVDRDGNVHWFRFDGSDPRNTAADTATAAGESFTAAALVGPGQVVAASAVNVVQWMSREGTTLRPRAEVPLRVPTRVVALVGRGAGEVVAVLADGTAVRVSPGRS